MPDLKEFEKEQLALHAANIMKGQGDSQSEEAAIDSIVFSLYRLTDSEQQYLLEL